MLLMIGAFFALIVYVKKIEVEQNNSLIDKLSCNSDSECVADGCCHSSSFVNSNYKPNCEGYVCTLSCEPGTMDCGQGSCKCIES